MLTIQGSIEDLNLFTIKANEQSYQSIYINPNADNWQEVIVFHEPIFDDEIPGVIALKSLRLEKCLGFVLAAPRNRIRYFREKVKDLDATDQLGKQAPRDILKQLLALTEEVGGTIVYCQGEHVDGPNEDIQGTPGPKKKKKEIKQGKSQKSKQQQNSDSFFDPLTKRKLVTMGPQYFDPSLPSMKDTFSSASFLSTKAQLLKSPTAKKYPENINPSNLSIWNKAFDKTTYHLKDNQSRWSYAKARYEKDCQELDVNPYKIKIFGTKEQILSDIKKSNVAAVWLLQEICADLRNNSFVADLTIRPKLKDVTISAECFYIISEVKLPLLRKAANVLSTVYDKHAFKYAIIAQAKNLYKQIDDRMSITITDTDQNYIVASISYCLPQEDAEKLYNTKSKDNLRFGIINLWKATHF